MARFDGTKTKTFFDDLFHLRQAVDGQPYFLEQHHVQTLFERNLIKIVDERFSSLWFLLLAAVFQSSLTTLNDPRSARAASNLLPIKNGSNLGLAPGAPNFTLLNLSNAATSSSRFAASRKSKEHAIDNLLEEFQGG